MRGARLRSPPKACIQSVRGYLDRACCHTVSAPSPIVAGNSRATTQSLRMRSSASGNWRSVKRELRVATSRRDPADCLAGGMRRSTIVTQFIIVLGLGGLGALTPL